MFFECMPFASESLGSALYNLGLNPVKSTFHVENSGIGAQKIFYSSLPQIKRIFSIFISSKIKIIKCLFLLQI